MVKKLPNPIDKYVGNRVRERRLALGMSQSKLAEAVGLTFQQIQKYERGTNRISGSRLQQFANILNVSAAFFFEGAPNASSQRKTKAIDPSISNVSEFISSSDGLALIKAFRQIKDAKLRRGIVNLVEQICQTGKFFQYRQQYQPDNIAPRRRAAFDMDFGAYRRRKAAHEHRQWPERISIVAHDRRLHADDRPRTHSRSCGSRPS